MSIRRAGWLVLVAVLACAQGVREGTLPRDGFDLHYRVYGEGAPVVLLSGGPGFDCDYLQPVALEVAKTNTSILVELRGTGRSRPRVIGNATVSLKSYLADLEALRVQLGLRHWSVLGHSAGAVLAMNYAAMYPERVTSLVLANSGPIRSASAPAMMDNILLRLSEKERKAVERSLTGSDVAASIRAMLPGYFFDRAKAAAMIADFRPESYHADTGKLLLADEMGPGMDLRPALKEFSAPVLIVAGRQDPLDPAVQYEIHLAVKNSQLKLIDRCGHFSWLEQPDEFYKSVRAFLDANAAS